MVIEFARTELLIGINQTQEEEYGTCKPAWEAKEVDAFAVDR